MNVHENQAKQDQRDGLCLLLRVGRLIAKENKVAQARIRGGMGCTHTPFQWPFFPTDKNQENGKKWQKEVKLIA